MLGSRLDTSPGEGIGKAFSWSKEAKVYPSLVGIPLPGRDPPEQR